MNKKLPFVFLVAIMICVAVYIGVFIGRTSARDILYLPDIESNRSIQEDEDFGSFSLIDLNQATADELTMIPGVNRTLAKAIIEYRSEYGDYVDTDELLDVDGMTEDLFESIEKYITVDN